MGPMTLWKHQNRSGDLLGPNCLRGPLFSFAVKPLYTDTRCVTALQSFTALYSAIRYTAIQLYSYTAIQRYTLYNLYNTPLIRGRLLASDLRQSLTGRAPYSARFYHPSAHQAVISGRVDTPTSELLSLAQGPIIMPPPPQLAAVPRSRHRPRYQDTLQQQSDG